MDTADKIRFILIDDDGIREVFYDEAKERTHLLLTNQHLPNHKSLERAFMERVMGGRLNAFHGPDDTSICWRLNNPPTGSTERFLDWSDFKTRLGPILIGKRNILGEIVSTKLAIEDIWKRIQVIEEDE